MALENPWLATTFTIEFPLLCLLVCLGVAFHIVWNCRIGRPLRSEDQVFASTYSRRNTCFDQTRLLEDIANATESCKGLRLKEYNGSCRGSQNSKLTLPSLTPALPSSNQVFTQVEMFKRVWFFLVVQTAYTARASVQCVVAAGVVLL